MSLVWLEHFFTELTRRRLPVLVVLPVDFTLVAIIGNQFGRPCILGWPSRTFARFSNPILVPQRSRHHHACATHFAALPRDDPVAAQPFLSPVLGAPS